MAMPSGADYVEALQYPDFCFQSNDLRLAIPEKRMGRPRPMTGNFAVVFKLVSTSATWAIRCFLRDVPDIQHRYRTIGSFLQTRPVKPAALVGFRYEPTGVLVRGARHPIVVMDWVRGRPLDRAIDELLASGQGLDDLVVQWQNLDRELDVLGIAHGDLQHGNVLLTDEGLRLVDYDGMFVPGLSGFQSNELGHPNYQHPARTTSDYSNKLDRFSSLLIFTALVALQTDPTLWIEYKSDESILFQVDDLKQPKNSRLFADLQYLRSDRLQRLTSAILRSIDTGTPPATIGDVILPGSSWLGFTAHEAVAPDQFQAPAPQNATPRSSWWQKAVGLQPPLEASPHDGSATPSVSSGKGWLQAIRDLLSGASSSTMPTSPNPSTLPQSTLSSRASNPVAPPPGNVLNQQTVPVPAKRAGVPTASWTKRTAAGGGSAPLSLVGSRSSHKYHRSSCQFGSKIPPGNQRWFTSIQDAERAGFAACRICRPSDVLAQVGYQQAMATSGIPVQTEWSALANAVQVGCKVTLEVSWGGLETYVIADRANTPGSYLSPYSPLAKAIIGRRVGERCSYAGGRGGNMWAKIVEVRC